MMRYKKNETCIRCNQSEEQIKKRWSEEASAKIAGKYEDTIFKEEWIQDGEYWRRKYVENSIMKWGKQEGESYYIQKNCE